jgi:hypothetical protein
LIPFLVDLLSFHSDGGDVFAHKVCPPYRFHFPLFSSHIFSVPPLQAAANELRAVNEIVLTSFPSQISTCLTSLCYVFGHCIIG